MADVIKIAKERRAKLVAEIARLDSFVRMAEVLLKYDQGLIMDAYPSSATALLLERDHLIGAADPEAVTSNTGVLKIPAQTGPAQIQFDEPAGINKVAVFPAGPDHFAFGDKVSASEEELVLDNPVPGSTASVDVHVGQRMRQRRWMLGMTQQQLGDLVGVEFEQIQKFETGAIHVGAGRMWDVATAMEVPMSYFFEGIEGQADKPGEAGGDVLPVQEALEAVHEAPQARKAQAS